MFDSFFCDTLNGMDCYDFHGEHETGTGYYGKANRGYATQTGFVLRKVRISAETPKAYLVSSVDPPDEPDLYKVRTGWYPKSRVKTVITSDGCVMAFPHWLVMAKHRDEISDEGC